MLKTEESCCHLEVKIGKFRERAVNTKEIILRVDIDVLSS